jgi:hypothetical protein
MPGLAVTTEAILALRRELPTLAQPMHLLIILFVALLFFGPSKVDKSRQMIGDGIRSLGMP